MIAGADERDAPSAGMVNGDAGGVLEDAERQLLPSRNCRATPPSFFGQVGASIQASEAARFSGLLTMWHGPCHTHSAKPALGSVEGLAGRGPARRAPHSGAVPWGTRLSSARRGRSRPGGGPAASPT